MGEGKLSTEKSRGPVWFLPVLFIFAEGLTVVLGYPLEEIIWYAVLLLIFGGGVQFLLFSEIRKNRIRGELKDGLKWYYYTFFISLPLTFVFSLLPVNGWPYPMIFTALSMFSNNILGIATGSLLLLISTMWSGDSSVLFYLVIFGSSLFAVAVFQAVDDEMTIFWPMFMTQSVFLGGLFAATVLEHRDRITAVIFIIPIINVFVNFLGLYITLTFYISNIGQKEELKFLQINDQMYPLLQRLKDEEPKEYYHAIHTAFFCDRIAKGIGADVNKCRSGGFYHRIGILEGEISWDNTRLLCTAHGFPEDACSILKEYLVSRGNLRSKEVCILYISDTVITAIMHLHAEKPDVRLDYDSIITRLIDKRLSGPNMADTDLSAHDIRIIREIFKREQLYYEIMK